MNSFKDRLKQIMSERKISQSELSRRTGIGRNSISDYLNGKYEAKQDKVFELAKALNVNKRGLWGLIFLRIEKLKITTSLPYTVNSRLQDKAMY